jgi:hypothetical protein
MPNKNGKAFPVAFSTADVAEFAIWIANSFSFLHAERGSQHENISF